MPRVTFITPNGEEVVVDDASGNLMSTAVDHGVDGIDGDCGGVGSCATCHVHIQAEWLGRVGAATETERDTLEFEEGVSECSRLGCQVELTSKLDGLVVRVVSR